MKGAGKQKIEMTIIIREETLLNDFNIVLILMNFLARKKYDVPIGDNKKIRMPSATRNKTMQIVLNNALRSNPIKEEKK